MEKKWEGALVGGSYCTTFHTKETQQQRRSLHVH